MSPNAYSDGTVFSKGKSRYNELHIKDTIIQVIHRLKDVGLIGFKEGYDLNVLSKWMLKVDSNVLNKIE